MFYVVVGIKFDAFLTSEHALNETCKALKVSSFRESTLRLFVEKLDATCLGQQKIKILLEQLDVEVISSEGSLLYFISSASTNENRKSIL